MLHHIIISNQFPAFLVFAELRNFFATERSKMRNLGFSVEIVQFLEIYIKMNVFIQQFNISNSPKK